jgi:hypothetical protein
MTDQALVAWVPYGYDWTIHGVEEIGGRLVSSWMPKHAAEELCKQLEEETKGNPGRYINVYKERV